MTRLIHLSDLHFGMERRDLIGPLAEAVRACDPDFLAVSGDLTQRAQSGQFRAALDWLETLRRPFLAVPGNHDLPLWNLPLRLVSPFLRYRRGVPERHSDVAQIGNLRLFGINTANPLAWRTGILRPRDVSRVAGALRRQNHAFTALSGRGESESDEDEILNLMVCHHPITVPPGFAQGETKGAAEGISQLLNAGLHAVLSGHLHHWSIGPGITSAAPGALLQVQTGTALCARPGERDHGFALIETQGRGLSVTPWLYSEAEDRFREGESRAFLRRGGEWHLASHYRPERAASGGQVFSFPAQKDPKPLRASGLSYR